MLSAHDRLDMIWSLTGRGHQNFLISSCSAKFQAFDEYPTNRSENSRVECNPCILADRLVPEVYVSAKTTVGKPVGISIPAGVADDILDFTERNPFGEVDE